MKQCIHNNAEKFCLYCWKKNQTKLLKPWQLAGFKTKEEFNNDCIRMGTSYN